MEEFDFKKSNLKNLMEDLEIKKNFLNENLEKEYDKFLELFENDKESLLDKINEVYKKEKNLMTQTKAKIEKQAIKLRSFIAEMECMQHDMNKLSNQEILEIDLSKLTELNHETSNVILESIKNKNTNFRFKDFNPIEECLLKKNEIVFNEYLEGKKKQADEIERRSLSQKFNIDINILPKELANSENIENNLSKLKLSKSNSNNDFMDYEFFKASNYNNYFKDSLSQNGNKKFNNFEENLMNKKDSLNKNSKFGSFSNAENVANDNSFLNNISVGHVSSHNIPFIPEISSNNKVNICLMKEEDINIDPNKNKEKNINLKDNNFKSPNNLLNYQSNNNSNSIILNCNVNSRNNLNNFNDRINTIYNSVANSDINTIPLEPQISPGIYQTEPNNEIINLGFNNSFRIEDNFNLSSNNNNHNNFTSNNFLNNSFYRKNSFTNNEIINTTNINFTPYHASARKKSELDLKQQKSSEKNYINNLNNNIQLKYKIIKNDDDQSTNFRHYINKTGFFDFEDLTDLILFIGDSKDKSILLFNKKNFIWKKLENSILGEYEFLDYCCLTKNSDNSYLISGGCIYSNYKNTAVNSTYLAKILKHKENFLISFIPFKQMNKPRFSHGSCTLKGKVYVYGGHDGASTLSCIEFFDPDAIIWKYVYDTEDYTSTSEMNVEREIFASCIIDDRYIYVFGGFNDIHLDSIEKFDVDTGKWQLLNIKLNSPLQNSTACYLGKGEIAIIGGYNGSLQRGIVIFNIYKMIWEQNYSDSKLIIPRRRAHCYKFNNKVKI